ncbi:hypothetical protein BKA61DRAFT_581492 [Leptodontidium sp. MPI-SDFR-AT-0119]|nr:hypothetical protein BKA61DRAFT_581492 [Leptodontidium sp. MPI-SDFR-AT-0119]
MLAPTTAQGRMIKVSRKMMIDEIEEVQFESKKVLSLEVEAAGYGKEIASYSSMLQDAVAIYLQAAMGMDTILALTIVEPRLSGLHMSLVSEHDRHSMLRTVLSRLPDHVSKLEDKILLVKGMADEYTAAIKAQLPFETADFEMPIIDLPFWSELDRLWELYFDVREEIDDCKRKSIDAQPAILVTHLSLDELLSKLEMERGFMGNDEGFSNAYAQDRDYNVTLSAAIQNHAPLPCLEWRLAQASDNTLATEESTPTSQSCPVVGSLAPTHLVPLQSAWGRQERLSTSRSSTSLDPASSNHAITPAIPAFAARLDCSNLATGQSCGTHRASSLTKPPRIHTQEQQQEQATRLGESVSKTCGSTIPPDIVLKIQRIASHEIMPTLWRYLRTQRTSLLETGVDQKPATTAPLDTVEDRIKRLLSRYQTQYEAFSDDDAYFPEFHRRLYLAHICGLYNQEKMTRRQN